MHEPTIDTQPEILPLDDAFIALLAELRAAAQSIESQARGALALYLRQNGLKGEWQIAPNGRELVKQQ